MEIKPRASFFASRVTRTTANQESTVVTNAFTLKRLAKYLDLNQVRHCYWSELDTLEKALFAFEPTSRIVPTTTTSITANITAYSAMS